MSEILNHRGQYFRVEIDEIVSTDAPDKPTYVARCSSGTRDLADLSRQSCSRLVSATPASSRDEALRQAREWLTNESHAQQPKKAKAGGSALSVLYTVWVIEGDRSSGIDFAEFHDAKAFAAAAEKGSEVTKVGIKNNESPQFLTVWERP